MTHVAYPRPGGTDGPEQHRPDPVATSERPGRIAFAGEHPRAVERPDRGAGAVRADG